MLFWFLVGLTNSNLFKNNNITNTLRSFRLMHTSFFNVSDIMTINMCICMCVYVSQIKMTCHTVIFIKWIRKNAHGCECVMKSCYYVCVRRQQFSIWHMYIYLYVFVWVILVKPHLIIWKSCSPTQLYYIHTLYELYLCWTYII